MASKCVILPEKCIACGLCQVLAPEIFDYNDEGIVVFLDQDAATTKQLIMPQQAEMLLNAYRKCPVRAILLED